MIYYDVIMFIIKMLIEMEIVYHYTTCDPIYLWMRTVAYLDDNYEDFKSYIKDDHRLINL